MKKKIFTVLFLFKHRRMTTKESLEFSSSHLNVVNVFGLFLGSFLIMIAVIFACVARNQSKIHQDGIFLKTHQKKITIFEVFQRILDPGTKSPLYSYPVKASSEFCNIFIVLFLCSNRKGQKNKSGQVLSSFYCTVQGKTR